ncbi:MAG: VOC family protein [Opitutaceae bacterium]|nr:VOC family protein [Opitutaceae bacterium]
MAVIKTPKPGEFCWADLGTTDVAAARKFYQGLFGWKVNDLPVGDGDFRYSLLRVQGRDVGAIYPMSAEQRKMKAPPFWLPYVAVKNVKRTVRKAQAAGGKICMEPMKIMEHGRMAILQDPPGASFGLWQAGKHPGSRLRNTPGAVCWHDLSTTKTGAAGKFYATTFGWKAQTMGVDGNAYHLFQLAKQGVGGMWPVPMKKLPPCWLTYWQVADCAKTVAKARRLGGRVLMGATTVPGYCRFAVLRDPQAAAFGILEPL